MRVLVVDDEVRFAQSLQRGLRAEGFDVDLAHDGETGLRLARGGGYDAVVLDVMLPRLSGYRVTERLRADGCDVPVLMLSAKDGEYDQADGLDLGADDYLTKPFAWVVFVARLKALLRRGAGGGAAGGGGAEPGRGRRARRCRGPRARPVRPHGHARRHARRSHGARVRPARAPAARRGPDGRQGRAPAGRPARAP